MPYTYTSNPIATDATSVGNSKLRKGPIDTAFNTANAQINTNTDEIEAARGSYGELADRLAAIDGGASATDQQLKDWTEAGSYEATAITYDGTYTEVVSTATVKWPDASAGTFTATTINATWQAIDAYTISHTASGKTVTQAAVTRNAAGSITAKPALTVA